MPPATTATHDANGHRLAELEEKWKARLMSPDYGQHHILALLLDPSKQAEECFAMSRDYVQTLLASAVPTKLSLAPLVDQLEQLDQSYPGGLLSYLQKARQLLRDSENQVNPYEGYQVLLPDVQTLHDVESDEFVELEEKGLSEACSRLAFVLVAGGLGERLGHSDIKLSLPVDLITGTCFAELYAQYILAYEALTGGPGGCLQAGDDKTNRGIDGGEGDLHRRRIPLVIMTSDDTHSQTVQLFESRNFFQLHRSQVTFLKQDKVAALADAQARIATTRQADGGVVIETKPHGHGDVHRLLLRSGLTEKWKAEGRQWVVFFQDTNPLLFRGLAAALGMSVQQKYAMNTIAAPRKIGETVGAMCKLMKRGDGSCLTINVEYNLLEALLKGNKEGADTDVANPKTGYSVYPGNINALIVNVPAYYRAISATSGAVPEFVNPKYRDSSRTVFKTPARLECMMQELPRLMSAADKVGITEMDRGLCFSAVKNAIEDAAAKLKKGIAGECAFTAEVDYFISNAQQLAMAHRRVHKLHGDKGGIGHLAQIGLTAPEDNPVTFQGMKYKMAPKVVLAPSWGVTRRQMCQRITPHSKLCLTDRSSLVLSGNVELNGLDLDGSLVLQAERGAKIRVRDLTVVNEGCSFEEVSDLAAAAPCEKVRGYAVKKKEAAEYRVKPEKDGEVLVLSGELNNNKPAAKVVETRERLSS